MVQTTQTRTRMCILGFRLYCCRFKGSNSPKPQFWGCEWAFSSQMCEKFKLSYFRNYCINCNQILHNDKNRQVPFVGGSNMAQTNPRCRTADILKNQNIAIHYISSTDWRILMKFAKVMHLSLRTLWANKIWQFLKSKMAAVAILKNKKIVISQKPFDQFWRNLTYWCISAF